MYSGLEKMLLKYVMLIHNLTLFGNQYNYITFKKQQQTFSQSHVYNYLYLICIGMKKDNLKNPTNFESERELYQFSNIYRRIFAHV